MTEYDRSEAHSQYHTQYRRFAHTGSCYYCGGNSEVLDHVPPLAVIHRLRGFTKFAEMLLVESCSICNSSLGDMPLNTPLERRDYIVNVFLPSRLEIISQQIQANETELEIYRDEFSRLHRLITVSYTHLTLPTKRIV